MMPSAVPTTDHSDAKWQALKKYIIRSREREKQEQEADAEVQRQRREQRERERKKKQNDMTLEEMKEEISDLEAKLSNLTEEKHQLFLQLKKVLNEDDNRRRQAVRETAELLGVGPNYPGMGAPLFLQPIQNRLPVYKIATTPNNAPGPGPSAGTKRPRSPSPPSSQGSHSYPSYNNYKSPNFQQPKPEDGRRNHEYVRAVLWNKGSGAASYGGVYGGVYGVAPSQPVYSYTGAPAATYEQVYLPRQPYDGKPDSEKVYLRSHAGPVPMPVHSTQPSKPGGISTGFPVRASHQPHSVYLPGGSNSGRLLYGTAPTSVPAAAARYQSSGAM